MCDIIEINEDVSCDISESCSDNIEVFSGTYEQFFKSFLLRNKPCLIKNVTGEWPCMKNWVYNDTPDFEYLKLRFGDAVVPVANCNEKYFNSQSKSTTSLQQFLSYWEDYIKNEYPDSEPCLYLKDWHFMQDFPEENVYTVPIQFSSDWLDEYVTSRQDVLDDYRFVYMGPKGSWTPFHSDVYNSYSWSVNICGQKKWLLLLPGEENKLKDKLNNLPYFFDSYELSYIKSHLKNVKFYLLTQNVGDAMFIPSGWFHQVWNTKDTISINHNWINGCNIERMWTSMKSDLEKVKKEISDLKDMDNWEEQCQIILKCSYGMNYEEFYNFMEYIMTQRIICFRAQTSLCVHGKWKFGTSHLAFDVKKIRLILGELFSDSDARMLSFFKKINHPL